MSKSTKETKRVLESLIAKQKTRTKQFMKMHNPDHIIIFNFWEWNHRCQLKIGELLNALSS